LLKRAKQAKEKNSASLNSASLEVMELQPLGCKDESSKSKALEEGLTEETPLLSKTKAEDVTTLRLGCFICIALSAFLGDASRGLVVPSIVPFIYSTGSGSSFVGWVNGMYALGRLIAAPLFGYWAEKRTFREAILINLVLFCIGNVLYAISGTSWMILASRTLVGLGSGTLGLARGYVVMSTTKEDRTHWISLLTAAQFAGYSVTPGLGALMSFFDIQIIGDDVEFDSFTLPGYFMAFLSMINAALIFWVWLEPPKPEPAPSTGKKMTMQSVRNYVLSYTGIGLFLFVNLQFVGRLAVAVYETLSQLIGANVFSWSVFTLGMVACSFGVVGMAVLFLQKPVVKYIPEQVLLLLGLAALIVGYFVFTPWGGLAEAHTLLLTQYSVGSVLIFSIGFPLTQALFLSCFSKLLGPIPQSAIMGWLASLGSLARVIGAVIAGAAFAHNITQIILCVTAILLAIPSIGLTVWYVLPNRGT